MQLTVRPTGTPVTATYWMSHAWLGTHVEPGVTLDVAGGRIAGVRTGIDAPPPGATALRGLTLPGLANTHSHAFHRALRSTVQVGSGTFWTWRELMYRAASRLTPDTYFDLARATYAEMALAGITSVGEFHYLHHAPGGTPYDNPNAMGEALIAAADAAGIRITLLDTAYLAAGFGERPNRHQLRFSDTTADAWAERASLLKGGDHALIGAAIHSVRAVPAGQLATVVRWAEERGAPLHVHLSEQTAENDACLTAHGRTPTRLLADHGVLGPRTTGIHNTHLTAEDIELLGNSGTGTCMCPTTERDLADGIGPAAALQRAGSPLSLGSDSHAVIDLFEEARAMELNERLRTHVRGHWTAAALLRAASADGHAALGRPDAGTLEPGAPADLTTVALDSVRTAGPAPRLAAEAAVFAASAADVRHTVVAGRHVVRDGRHTLVEDVPSALAEAIAALHG
ncbi:MULTISPECIES: formimidoylglutamate deiminase [Streptomyces]|uniref:Formiminoglutamate deiminase n=1 Tax=Streptomyces clavifer TaxID=68188 RepID=A0ABS4VAT4_9ACTN|nr:MULTISPECIES: formimidoylglutamate deiminase [Streptomyces]KQX90648.1 N-formimino-L-glutamate deiminase [Streptomyces sp. Root1319]KQZ03343.1 N-formimino-L-glutamate deiminase [Streptomyces sp. Root55]MBP2360947.1 formiminoglutamate deiminase [Streptomyces clavifer]MDX2745884.1 formimidoylglutamate deiminase [Streptomyces sp. NRRL_B-2557]GHB13026.1 formimidoylglutamate deiminase [Streptomyces clavifer]